MMSKTARNMRGVSAWVTFDGEYRHPLRPGGYTLWGLGHSGKLFVNKNDQPFSEWDSKKIGSNANGDQDEPVSLALFMATHQRPHRYCVMTQEESKILPRWLRKIGPEKANWPKRVTLFFGAERA